MYGERRASTRMASLVGQIGQSVDQQVGREGDRRCVLAFDIGALFSLECSEQF